MTTTRERRERRAQRREEWAEGRRSKQAGAFEATQRIADGIPPGQPILVGHHSEKHHRRDLDRMDRNMRKGIEHGEMAERHDQAADTIRRQLANSVYDDDRDATERLQARIERREAQRERIKAVNRAAAAVCRRHGIRRKGHYWSAPEEQRETARAALADLCKQVEATPREIDDLTASLTHGGAVGYESYHLSNLGANIRRDRQRLTRLQRERGQA